MSFYVSKSCCINNENGSTKNYVTNLLFHVDAIQYNSLLKLKFYVGIHCKFNLPINAILLDIESNILSSQNINLNIDFTNQHYTFLTGFINVNINESNILNKPLWNFNTYFIGSFKINDEAFNRANIDMNDTSYSSFVNELYSYNNKIIDDKTNINNLFDLKELNIANVSQKYLNDYNNFSRLPKDFYTLNNPTNPFNPQLIVDDYINKFRVYYLNKFFKILNNKNSQLELSEIGINIEYLIDNKTKYFKLNNIKENELRTNFNYLTNEIIVDNQNGVNGIYIPKQSKIKLMLWFKYQYCYYYIDYKIINDLDLFGSKAKSLIGWEVVNEI